MLFELLGGMVCCVVLVCLIVFDFELIMYDEFFVG